MVGESQLLQDVGDPAPAVGGGQAELIELEFGHQGVDERVDLLLEMLDDQVELGGWRGISGEELERVLQLRTSIASEVEQLRESLSEVIGDADAVNALVDQARDLSERVKLVVQSVDETIGNPRIPPPADVALQQTLEATGPLLGYAESVRSGITYRPPRKVMKSS